MIHFCEIAEQMDCNIMFLMFMICRYRPMVKDIVIVISDGGSNPDFAVPGSSLETEAQLLRETGVKFTRL